LMAVLRKHRKAFGYSLADLKGTSPTIASHIPRIWSQTSFGFPKKTKTSNEGGGKKRGNTVS
jgi:hypothetical protein